MAALDDPTEPLSTSYHHIVRPPTRPPDEPATFSLSSLFSATTAFAIYLGLVNRSPSATYELTPLLCFALTFIYFTRHYQLCFGRAMVRAIAVGTISAGVLPIVLSLGGRSVDPGIVMLSCLLGFFICGSAAFVLAVGTVLFEACIGR